MPEKLPCGFPQTKKNHRTIVLKTIKLKTQDKLQNYPCYIIVIFENKLANQI